MKTSPLFIFTSTLFPSAVRRLSWRVLVCLITLCRAHYTPFSLAHLVLSSPNLHATWQSQRHDRHGSTFRVPFLIIAKPLFASMTSASQELMLSLNYWGSSTSALSIPGMLVWALVAGFLPACYFACVDKEFSGPFFQSTRYFEILLQFFMILLHFYYPKWLCTISKSCTCLHLLFLRDLEIHWADLVVSFHCEYWPCPLFPVINSYWSMWIPSFLSHDTSPKLFETEKHTGSFISIRMFPTSFRDTWLSSAKTRQLFLKTLCMSSFPSSSWDHLALP